MNIKTKKGIAGAAVVGLLLGGAILGLFASFVGHLQEKADHFTATSK